MEENNQGVLGDLLSFDPEAVDVQALEQENQMRLQIASQIAHKLGQARAKLEQLLAIAKKGAPSPKLMEEIHKLRTWIAMAENAGDAELQEYTLLAEVGERVLTMGKTDSDAYALLNELLAKKLWREATEQEEQFARAAAVDRRPWPDGYFFYDNKGYMPVNGTSLASADLKMKVSAFFKQIGLMRREHGIKAVLERGSNDLKPMLENPSVFGRYSVYLPSSSSHKDGAILLETRTLYGDAVVFLQAVAGSCGRLEKWIGKYFLLSLLNAGNPLPSEMNSFYRSMVEQVRGVFWEAYFAANPTQEPDTIDDPDVVSNGSTSEEVAG